MFVPCGLFFFMSTRFILEIVPKDGSTYQVFLNQNDEIFIGVQDGGIDDRFVTIPVEDWPEVKSYIDNLIFENKI